MMEIVCHLYSTIHVQPNVKEKTTISGKEQNTYDALEWTLNPEE